MTVDAFWQLFTETGDPVCWLMSRAERRRGARSGQDDEKGGGREGDGHSPPA